MAGIGFELRKLFSNKGVLATMRAYGYTAIVSTGPMLLSILFLIGIRFLSTYRGIDHQTQDLIVSMITYCLLWSLVLSNVLSMVTTRYTADMLYEEKQEYILPSLYGSLVILLSVGSFGYGIFLAFSGVSVWCQVLNLILFCELVVVWTQMSYLTAIHEFRNILIVFACSVFTALLFGYCVINWFNINMVTALMGSMIMGYGLIMMGFFLLLHHHFPKGKGSIYRFLSVIDRYPSLLFIGLFLTIGLFAHIIMNWFAPSGMQIKGFFYGAPQYDIPALAAFLSLLAATINFTVSVEVKFYPLYRDYINLFNEGGALSDIQLAEDEMLTVLRQEINYLAYRQFVVAVLFIIIGTPLLAHSNLGFSETMLGTFRVLCIGYALYAVANCLLLIQLYFSDNTGAFWTSAVFMSSCFAGTLIFLNRAQVYSGFGFLCAGVAMYLVAWIRLWKYTSNLQHHILSAQPVFQQSSIGPFERIGLWLDSLSEKIPAHTRLNQSLQQHHSK